MPLRSTLENPRIKLVESNIISRVVWSYTVIVRGFNIYDKFSPEAIILQIRKINDQSSRRLGFLGQAQALSRLVTAPALGCGKA